jgi:hypothetical protein
MALAACAKPQLGPPDLSGNDDGGRNIDLAGADLLQPETHDLGLCGNCDDGVACTIDTCLPTAMCNHAPDHSKCGDRQLCTATGCVGVETTKMCAFCNTDADCGTDETCVPLETGDAGTKLFCLPHCATGAGCPKGFVCDTMKSRCVPDSDSGLCCYDGDGDSHGVGAGCLGTDCDDSDPNVYPGHAESCDGKDNNCDGNIDEGYLCGGPTCAALGTTNTFSGTAIPACTAGTCAMPTSAYCGNYTCQAISTPVAGNACRTACSGIDDTACIASAYCDGAACDAQLQDGGACTRDRMCVSGHCQNGHCCQSGDCCNIAADCPAGAYSTAAACDAPPTSCQGHRDDPTCNAQKQCAKLHVDDDSACGASISIDCTPLAPEACTGMATQTPLACPTHCSNDNQCVATAYCNGTNCVARQPDGGACTMDDQCLQGHHCLNGFCCNASTGACCATAASCPASYGAAAVCDSPLTSCQGHRIDKTCTSSICGSTSVADDSACTSAVTMSCGTYNPVTCNGLATQSPLLCPASCSNDNQCVQPADHCLNSTCQPWVDNGGACSTPSQCRSGFCVAGACCSVACNSTTCDTCGGGACMPFADPLEDGNTCLDSLPDLGTGAFTASVMAYLQSASDTEDWYQFYATDASNSCTGFINVQLTVPSGVDYDVYLYFTADGSCGGANLLVAGLSSSGNENVTFNESCSVSDEGWYLVRVVRYSGQSCTMPYTLTVNARL